MSTLLRSLRADLIAAYTARYALTLVSLVMRPLPRRNKVTLLTRQSSTPPSDFIMLRDAILREDPTVEVVMVSQMVPPGIIRKFGYAVHLIVEMYHAETSRALVIDGYSIVSSAVRPSDDLLVVQAWHALGALKKFGLSIVGRRGGRDPRLAKAMRMHEGYDVVIASAERCREPFAEAFGVDVSKVVVAPLPRVDRLRDPVARERAQARLARLYPDLGDAKIALFAPTFRTEGIAPSIDPVDLTEAMRDAGYVTVTKLHPLVPAPTTPGLRTAPGMSTQELLLVADLFITDYSSAVFEAAVAEVPSYLIAPDLDDYIQRRDFYVRYPDDLGLPMARSIEELVEQVREGASNTRTAAAFIADPQGTGGASAHIARVIMGRSAGTGIEEAAASHIEETER